MTSQQTAFLAAVIPAARASMGAYGVPASVTIAQAIFESSDVDGWGQSPLALGYDNYFGIKATHLADPDSYVEFPTAEYVGGKRELVKADFARYATPAASFLAHAELLATAKRYAPAMAVKSNFAKFAAQLQGCGYSTSPSYGSALVRLIEEYGLDKYDAAAVSDQLSVAGLPAVSAPAAVPQSLSPVVPWASSPSLAATSKPAPVLAGVSSAPEPFPPTLKKFITQPIQGEETMQSIFANIWNHPVTSVTGILAAVVTGTGVLSQQGITLGHAGTGTVVALCGALATALLGLVAKDPGSAPQIPASGGKLGVLMLVALLMSSLVSSGCSGATVAQDIVNWTPALQSAVTAVDATAAVLDPAAAPIFAAATAGFDAADAELVAQAKAYLAAPSASVLARLQAAVVTFQQTVNAALLKVAGVGSPAAQQKALADIQGVSAIVNTILALVTSISSKAAVARMAADSPIKLAALRRYEARQTTTDLIAAHYEVSSWAARRAAVNSEAQLTWAGF
jgi:hypothetical protein